MKRTDQKLQNMEMLLAHMQQVHMLNKIECYGQRPDLEALSREELQVIFNLAAKDIIINTIPDSHPDGTLTHQPYAPINLYDKSAESFSDKNLREIIDTVLSYRGYQIPREVLIQKQISSIHTSGDFMRGIAEMTQWEPEQVGRVQALVGAANQQAEMLINGLYPQQFKRKRDDDEGVAPMQEDTPFLRDWTARIAREERDKGNARNL